VNTEAALQLLLYGLNLEERLPQRLSTLMVVNVVCGDKVFKCIERVYRLYMQLQGFAWKHQTQEALPAIPIVSDIINSCQIVLLGIQVLAIGVPD
jgi:hypothetical protein